MNDPTKAVVTKSEHAVYRIVDGEAVIVEPQNGLVNVINEVGSRIWELVDGKRTLTEIANTIASEYDVSQEQALADTKEFLQDLQEKRLISLSPNRKSEI